MPKRLAAQQAAVTLIAIARGLLLLAASIVDQDAVATGVVAGAAPDAGIANGGPAPAATPASPGAVASAGSSSGPAGRVRQAEGHGEDPVEDCAGAGSEDHAAGSSSWASRSSSGCGGSLHDVASGCLGVGQESKAAIGPAAGALACSPSALLAGSSPWLSVPDLDLGPVAAAIAEAAAAAAAPPGGELLFRHAGSRLAASATPRSLSAAVAAAQPLDPIAAGTQTAALGGLSCGAWGAWGLGGAGGGGSGGAGATSVNALCEGVRLWPNPWSQPQTAQSTFPPPDPGSAFGPPFGLDQQPLLEELRCKICLLRLAECGFVHLDGICLAACSACASVALASDPQPRCPACHRPAATALMVRTTPHSLQE
ncbi:hypothetical protein GPECTOR_10g921 [Gonium pectorale]|uniref:RING-type domain-containing protein n=1 Tax=Gonium pectorale TaxID=33097 RepID=A0A150GR22_GONPE|nr:hypothetical protein GPECTOR_10g921 [Gonium pectorale]|eukprot:KXZ52289.1 hypothetical protein GPECTOR_10g921 [Gonium pectorale]